MCVCVCVCHSIKRGTLEITFFKEFYPINENSASFGIGLLQKFFCTRKKVSFEAIQNGDKSIIMFVIKYLMAEK